MKLLHCVVLLLGFFLSGALGIYVPSPSSRLPRVGDACAPNGVYVLVYGGDAQRQCLCDNYVINNNLCKIPF